MLQTQIYCRAILIGIWLQSYTGNSATIIENDATNARLILSISKAERKKLLKTPKVLLIHPKSPQDSMTCIVTKLGTAKVTLESDTDDFTAWKKGMKFNVSDTKTFVPDLENLQTPPEFPEFKPIQLDPKLPLLYTTAPFGVPGMPPQSELLLLQPLWRDEVVQPTQLLFGFDLYQNDLKSMQSDENHGTLDGYLLGVHSAAPLQGYRNSSLTISAQHGASKSTRAGLKLPSTKRSQLDLSFERGFFKAFSLLVGASMVAYEGSSALGSTSQQGIVAYATFNFWFENTRFGFSYIPSPPSRVKQADHSERNRYRLMLTHGGSKLHFYGFYDLRFADEQNPLKREDRLLQIGLGTQGKTLRTTLVTYFTEIEARQSQALVTSSSASAARLDISWLGKQFFSATAGAGVQHLRQHDRIGAESKKQQGYGFLGKLSIQQGF